ncbi:reverse transcriptase domain-containing protein [Tanacetum coccineum]
METASRLTCDVVTTTPVTRLYLMRRSLEDLRKFHWMILGGRFNQLSHVLLENIRDYVQLKCRGKISYCPPGRTRKKMEEIINFQQEPDETLYQAWERFKELLMKCPQHYLTEM